MIIINYRRIKRDAIAIETSKDTQQNVRDADTLSFIINHFDTSIVVPNNLFADEKRSCFR